MKKSLLILLFIQYCYAYVPNTIFKMNLNNNNNNNKNNNNICRRNILYYGIGANLLNIATIKGANAYSSAYRKIDTNNILKYIEEEQEKIFKNAIPSVCYISTEYTSMAEKLNLNKDDLPKGVGTGFVWDKKGHIVTNFHVINKVDNAQVTITTENNEKIIYNAKLTGVDPDTDLAILKIDAPEKHLKLINYKKNIKTHVGQLAFAIGNPFGQDHSLTSGIISANNRELAAPTGRKIYNVIQTDAAINPGNSGGPLLNSNGELIGINTASLGMGVSAGIGFTIPIQNAIKSINDIIETGFVQKAILGISYMERNPTFSESERSGIPIIKKGLLILEVPPNSPALEAGLRGLKRDSENKKFEHIGDIILSINNDNINNPIDLNNILKKYKPNDVVKVKYLRDEKEYITDLILGCYKGTTFTKLENERGSEFEKKGNPIDIPLKDLEPVISPKL